MACSRAKFIFIYYRCAFAVILKESIYYIEKKWTCILDYVFSVCYGLLSNILQAKQSLEVSCSYFNMRTAWFLNLRLRKMAVNYRVLHFSVRYWPLICREFAADKRNKNEEVKLEIL